MIAQPAVTLPGRVHIIGIQCSIRGKQPSGNANGQCQRGPL